MLSILDFDWVKQLFKSLREVGINIPDSYASIIALVLSLVVVLSPIIVTIIKTHNWRKKRRNWRKLQIEELPKFYNKNITRLQRWLYIKTRFQETPPDEHEAPSKKHKKSKQTSSIDFFVRKVLKLNNQEQTHFLILGGSGMGKTFFVAQLVRRYIYKYSKESRPFPLKLLYCRKISESEKPLLERINGIDRNTILILDALDENNDAIENYGRFLKDLFVLIAEFKIVIITCRTQFFEKQEDEVRKVPIGNPSSLELDTIKRFYISPFTDKDVKKYLNRKYFLKFSDRKKAQVIADNSKEVMSRPLLLSFMDDLLNANIPEGKESIINIYEILIDKWLEREATFAITDSDMEEERRKTYKQNLLNFSNELALCMAQPSYDQSQIKKIIKDFHDKTEIPEQSLKIRSLLNRNADDEYEFAHKSFMEYLVAKQLIRQKEETGWFSLENIDCISNDMIPLFLFYMMSKGLPTIITFSDNKVFFYNGYFYRHLLCIKDDDSTTVGLNLSAFLKTICNTKYNSLPVNISIDCTYEYLGLITSINDIFSNHTEVAYLDKSEKIRITSNNKGEKNIIPDLIFENYNFGDSGMVDFIVNITHIIPCYFLVYNNNLKETADSHIVSRLIELAGAKEEKIYITSHKESATPIPLSEYFSYMRNYILEKIILIDDTLTHQFPNYITTKCFDAGAEYFFTYFEELALKQFECALEESQDEFGNGGWLTRSIQEIIDLLKYKFKCDVASSNLKR